MKLKFVILIVGILGGAAIVHFYGAPIRQTVGLEGREVEARVLEERRDEDGRLVLMLESDGESMLATFSERADDVASLVHEGDVISFRAPIHGVFSDDVPLLSVRRASEAESGEGEGSEERELDGEELDEEELEAEELDEEELDEEELEEEELDEAEDDTEPSEDLREVEEAAPMADSTRAEDLESAES